MAYHEVGMWEILNVLKRIARGESKTAIKEATGRSRKTIRKYVHLAEELGWVAGLHEPDELLAAEVLRQVKPGRKDDDPGEVEKLLLPHRQRISDWLAGEPGDKRGLRLTKVHQLLERLKVEVPYSSLHRFAVKHCGFADKRRLTVRLADCEPGEEAQVDFGRLGLVPDPETGRRQTVHALLVTLVHSRHQYVHITCSQKLSDLIEGIEDAWEFFGGVPARVIIDNLKAAVTKADRYDPVFQRVFEEYADYRGFEIDAAVAGHPKGKPHVERNVPYVRDNFFRGETWLDSEHVKREAIRWCVKTAGTRTHGTTKQQPLAVFENVEKAALTPLDVEKERFDTPLWGECTIHPDHHISFGKALYSVPTKYVRQRKKLKVDVRGDSRLVRLYVKGELIKTHPRQAPGGRSTDYDDYPEELAPYARRDPDRMVREAQTRGEHVGRFMQELLSGAFPWSKLRQAQKLLRLGNKYGWPRVDQSCRRALAFDLINVKRVERIIKQGLDRLNQPRLPETPEPVAQLPLRFQRPNTSFVHHPNQGDSDEQREPIVEDRTETTAAVRNPSDTD